MCRLFARCERARLLRLRRTPTSFFPIRATSAPRLRFLNWPMSNSLTIPQIDWAMILPVTIVSMAGILALILETISPKRAGAAKWLISILGLGAAAFSLYNQSLLPDSDTLNGLLIRDRFSLVVQFLIVGAALLSILFSEEYLGEKHIAFGEFYPLAL